MADVTTYPVVSVRKGMTMVFGKLSMVDGTTTDPAQGNIGVSTMDPGSYGAMVPYSAETGVGYTNMVSDGFVGIGTDDEWNDFLGIFCLMQEDRTSGLHDPAHFIRPTLYSTTQPDGVKPGRRHCSLLLTNFGDSGAQATYLNVAQKSIYFMMLCDNTDRR